MDKNRRGRRSKNDNNGRVYRCEKCMKSYLSYPALYTHTKTKHDKGDLTNNRGRGRPKKDNGDTTNFKTFLNPLTIDYFKHEDRSGKIDDQDLINIFSETVKSTLMSNDEKYKDKIRKIPQKCDDHNVYKILLKYIQTQNIEHDENKKCDEVIAEYIMKMKLHVNSSYMKKLIKFLLLFREALNILFCPRLENSDLDYSSVNTAEDAPEVSNEFLLEYLDIENEKFGFTKEESIELTQNFCQWMFDNGYTSSKLTLASV